MVRFREKKNGNIWYIYEKEHIEHFRSNPRFEEIKENDKNRKNKIRKNKSSNCFEQEGNKK